MNNLIKKIIRESLDSDWSWTQFEPVEPRKKGEVRVGDVYTIYGSDESIRYVLEIVKNNDYNNIYDYEDDEDEDDDGSGTIHYKIHVTADEEDEPVGSISTVNKKRAERLIVQDNHWVLTDSLDKGFNPLKEEAEDDLDWIKEIEPDVESLAHKALSKSNNFIVETEYYGNNLYNIEFYASDGSGRYFGVNSSNTENSFITYEDIVEQARKDLESCYTNNVSEEIMEEYRELYNLLKNY